MNSHSIWVKLDRYPPVLVRLLARRGSKIMSDSDIVSRSGLTLSDVMMLSYAPNWEGIAVDTMRKFTEACGVRFENRQCMRRLTRYLSKNPRFKHLYNDPQTNVYVDMLKMYYNYETHPSRLQKDSR